MAEKQNATNHKHTQLAWLEIKTRSGHWTNAKPLDVSTEGTSHKVQVCHEQQALSKIFQSNPVKATVTATTAAATQVHQRHLLDTRTHGQASIVLHLHR